MNPSEPSAIKEASGAPAILADVVVSSPSFLLLFLASFVALYFELVVIRYLATEIRIFAYLKNLALIASFFGIGLGMILEKTSRTLKRLFPWITATLLLLIRFASVFKLTHLPIPTFGYKVYTVQPIVLSGNFHALSVFVTILIYLAVVPGIMYLIVAFFTTLGGFVGESLRQFAPLPGYGINLAGSLAGIAIFTVVSFLGAPPAVWILLGLLAVVPFFARQRLALVVFGLTVGVMALPQPGTSWSPYYRIELSEVPPPTGWPHPAAYWASVNHDFHQVMIDMSPEFTTKYPDFVPNKYVRSYLELPYRFDPHPNRVLVVGAGTGNDVASALEHGANHVDAVEIDPYILALGRKYHSNHPYDSPRVTVFVDDARAFFTKTTEKYDLIVFAALDSQTMLSSLSSIRLDNYVYTVESFREARSLLKQNGTLVMTFGSGKTFLSERLFAMLENAFQKSPLAYSTGNGIGVAFVEGYGATPQTIEGYPEITGEMQSHVASALLAADHWPFLYLESRTIPFAIWTVLVLFLYFATVTLQRRVPLRRIASRQGLHLFFLGAGFMLLETKGVTELSLLFGSTWIVNAVVIAAFLTMGLLANTVIRIRPVSRKVAYSLLIVILAAGMFVPYALLEALATPEKVMAAAFLAGLPVFFSGMIFSRSFKDVEQPAQALGINLLGAVVGGVLENLVMVGGTAILGFLALVLYGLSAGCVPGLSSQQETSTELGGAIAKPASLE